MQLKEASRVKPIVRIGGGKLTFSGLEHTESLEGGYFGYLRLKKRQFRGNSYSIASGELLELMAEADRQF